jgi:hypothetical protein
VAVAVLLATTLLARDVVRAAHGTRGNAVSIARTFAALANASEASWLDLAQSTSLLLAAGPSLTPQQAVGQWARLRRARADLAAAGATLGSPAIGANLQRQFDRVLQLRLAAWDDIDRTVSATLWWRLVTGASSSVLRTDEWRFARADTLWRQLDHRLRSLGLGAWLRTGSTALATGNLVAAVQTTTTAPSLQPRGGVAFATLSVNPQPLPTAGGDLVLLPVTSVALGIAVTNSLWVSQTAIVDVTLRSANGPSFHQSATLVIAPVGAAALQIPAVAMKSNERGVLTVRITAPHLGRPTERHWTIHVAP